MALVRTQWIPMVGVVAVLLSLAGLVLSARAHSSKTSGRDGEPLNLTKFRQTPTATLLSGDVDLLSLLRLPEDAIAGEWGFLKSSLVSPLDRFPRIQFPIIPPAEYDLRLTATRLRGSNSLNLGLLLDGRQTMVALDGNDGATSWLFLLIPEGTPNPSSHLGQVLLHHQPTRILCSVRKSSVRVAVEGKTVIDWKGDPYDTCLLADYLVPNPEALLLGSWESSFKIDELFLVPVSGTPTLLR